MASEAGGGPVGTDTAVDVRPGGSADHPTSELSSAEIRRLARGHARRVTRLDPLVPFPAELLLDEDPGVIVTPSDPEPEGLLIGVRSGDSTAAGRWTTDELDPTDYQASFGWLRSHRLRLGLDGPDRSSALGRLLDRWLGELADTGSADELDTGAAITWPARDVTGVAELVRHGFGPDVVLAVRRIERDPADQVSAVPAATGVVFRPARLEDIDTVVALHLEELLFDDRLGGLHLRSSVERALRGVEVAALSRNDGSRILALRDGLPVGLVAVSPPAESGWIASLVNAERVGYLECLSVTEPARGTGIGPLLVRAAHERLAEDAVDVVLLHHSPVNPYSAPFWARQGYRPLWIRWTRPITTP